MTGLLPSRASLTELQFNRISDMVKKLCGINLHGGKRELVHARLNKRLRCLSLNSFGEYLDLLDGESGPSEIVYMLDLLSTNVTQFLREPAHFQFLHALLRDQARPASQPTTPRARPARPPGAIRIWSAGCSSGEEPYSIAMTLADALPADRLADVRVLATDLSTRALAKAKAAVYPAAALSALPIAWRSRYLNACDRQPSRGKMMKVDDKIGRLVCFARLNLLDPWPMRGPFDVIFCRNVMIYFDKKLQAELVGRFYRLLSPGGHLLLGHSESLAGVGHEFDYVQPTIYRRPR